MSGKVLVIGTNFSDARAVETQGQILAHQLNVSGYHVKIVSSYRNPVFRTLETLCAVLTITRSDLVLIQVYGTKSIYLEVLSALFTKLKGAKLVSTLHGGSIPDFYNQNSIKRVLLRCLFKWSSTITVPSDFIVSKLPQIAFKTERIRNIIPQNIAKIPAPRKQDTILRIVWMRAYHPTYNPVLAIDVVERLMGKGIAVHMHMAGPDLGMFGQVEQILADRHLQHVITLHKKLTQEQISELASQSDAYLCTNSVDNAPVTFIEMMRRGIPVVSTSVGGIPFLVQNRKEALLTNKHTPEALAELLIELKSNDQLRNQLSANGLILAEAYTADKVVEDWDKLFARYQIFKKPWANRIKILFLGEYNAISIPWINGIKEFGKFYVTTWNLSNRVTGIRRTFLFLTKMLELGNVIKRFQPDLIIGYRITSYGFLASLFKKRAVLVIAQQGITDAYPNSCCLINLKRMAQRFSYRKADLIHAWGEVMLPEMLKYNADPNKILVLPKGIDLHAFEFTPHYPIQKIKAVVTRSLSAEYRHDIILKAFSILKKESIPFELTIAGNGKDFNKLLHLKDTLGFGNEVTFTGRLPMEEIPALLRDKNLYLSVPITEGVSSSLAEAMATGCYPIVSDIPGNRYWIKDKMNGCLVPVDDPVALASAIRWWLSSQTDFSDALQQNRNLVETHFSLKHNMKIFCDKYEELVNHVRN